MEHHQEEIPTAGLLRLAYNDLSAQILAAVSDSGFDDLRPAHGNAMEHLSYEDGLRLTQLSARANMAPQSMAELVDELEQLGYLERRADPNDRRAKRIHLTPRGRKNVRAAGRAVDRTEKGLRQLLGDDRYRDLRNALRAIIDATEAQGESP